MNDDRGLLIAFPVWAHFGITGRTEMIRLLVKLRQPRSKHDTAQPRKRKMRRKSTLARYSDNYPVDIFP